MRRRIKIGGKVVGKPEKDEPTSIDMPSVTAQEQARDQVRLAITRQIHQMQETMAEELAGQFAQQLIFGGNSSNQRQLRSGVGTQYSLMTRRQLVRLCAEAGIDFIANASKADLVEALETHDEEYPL